MKAWVLSVFAASLLSSLALALCPEGRVRSVTRMVCGILCALAVASPLGQVDLDRLAAELAAYGQRAHMVTETEEEDRKMLERTYIEDQCAAYILAEAASLDAAVESVSVRACWDDEALVWVPWEAVMTGRYSEALARAVEAELGIPAGRQEWREETAADAGVD